ncbi:hypothetical protein N0V94_004863 [Neodidymelliopsis sp. IMI 364377]|nr:hypothetical protein N0V94_004863 [Neodidymelliopsis sp. IMI 364377]
MKSTLKPSRSVGANLNRRSAPPTVRFLDPEPVLRRSTEPGKTMSLKSPGSVSRPARPGNFRTVSSPNLGPHQYQPKKIMIATLTRPALISPASKRASTMSSPGFAMSSQRTMSPTQSHPGPVPQPKQRVDKRISAPAATSQMDSRLDSRWSGIPLPAGFNPPSRTSTPTQRTTSYQSIVTNLTSSSAPSAVTPPSSTPSKQYDPMQNYIPCMAAMCTAHYTPIHSGPTYYVVQEPYNLSRHHGYCPRHASKEMKEANALCKKEYETMRQHAGRKTLGVVAQDFEIFLQLYREARKAEDARLQKAQSQRVLGTSRSSNVDGDMSQKGGWDWRYTPRNCTSQNCTSLPYSTFSTHLYSFYNTPHSVTQLLPLSTQCPSCSKTETEGFGAKLMEKWSSRCGWDGEEWDGWYQNVKRDRELESEFWEKAQERVVRERIVKKIDGGAAEQLQEKEDTQGQSTVEATPKREKGKRKSVFKRMFGRSNSTVATTAAVAA